MDKNKKEEDKDTIILDEHGLPSYSYGADTELLEDALMREADYALFSTKYKDDIGLSSFVSSLRKLLTAKDMDLSQIPLKTGMNRSYFYQIANGTRSPSRDKILIIGFALRASFDEINYLLRSAERQALYARNKRDSVIIYALNHRYSLEECNQLLEQNNHQVLA